MEGSDSDDNVMLSDLSRKARTILCLLGVQDV